MLTIYILFNLPRPSVAAAQILHIYIERHLHAEKRTDRLGYIITCKPHLSLTLPSHLSHARAHHVPQNPQLLHYLSPPYSHPLLA